MKHIINIGFKRLAFAPTLFACFFILFGADANAGVYDGSVSKYRARLIAHEITPQRVAILENRIQRSGGTDTVSIRKMKYFSKRTVFWKGRVTHFLTYPDNYWLRVHPRKGNDFWIYAKKSVRNLDFNRKGYRIGVKGVMTLRNNRLSYLQAKSIVIIAPPANMAYGKFVKKHRLSDVATVNTSAGQVRIKHRHYPFILHKIYTHNPHYPWKTIEKIGSGIIYYSRKYRVDPLLVTALFNVESAFDVDAVSPSGAIGLGQLMPSTAAGLGVNPHNVFQNIGGAVKYLSGQLRRWRNSRRCDHLALASYNAGPGAVGRYGGIPPYSETRNYVFFISFLRKEYDRQFNGSDIEEEAEEAASK